MSFLDALTRALRAPPGREEVGDEPPPGAMEAWRRLIVQELSLHPHGSVESWSDRERQRSLLRRAWAESGALLGGVVRADERARHVGEALRRSLDTPTPTSEDNPLFESEIARISGFIRRLTLPDGDWRDPVRYLVELGALAADAAARLPLGDALLSLGPRDRVIALLHAEVLQSTGGDDPFRMPAGAILHVLQEREGRDRTQWGVRFRHLLDRLEGFGILGYSGLQLDFWHLHADREPWLQDVVADPPTPLRFLVRSALEGHTNRTIHQLLGSEAPTSQQVFADFAATLRHELGNISAAQISNLRQLGADLPPDDRRLRRLTGLADRLGQLAGSLDKLAPTEREVYTPVELVELVRDALAQTAAERNGHLAVELHLPSRVVLVPRERVVLAFTNLMRNAAQAASGRSCTLQIRGEHADGAVHLTFEDDGPGVPRDLEGRLFDRGVSGRGGTGLGLSLVHDVIVRELQGRVWHERPPGGGARFALYIPCEEG